jgi:AcrR family transcriptional regulator
MLIEVARQLFAQHGKKEVTMNDIAEASKKGRRTLYTYFNNKEEIYKAVIDKELSTVLDRLNLISTQNAEPDVKLTNHILTHLDAIKDIVNRNGSLRADFFMDIYEVERTRRKIDLKEIALIRNIITEGIEKNIFKRMDPDLSSIIILYSLKGLEVPYIRQGISADFEQNKNSIVEFVFMGIKKKHS